ncbi:hypothetical protein TNIN_237151 [Trichonephila inaurata madagascariensis]|uniref:Uncharacterized protein n=1 Tax=Trichonephila inaurata madagascariensis TaxID=2747483 RepID=A0A8X6XK42_9ARAC|nr:hypothetical protein TNIN_237151 [Trichonephila inaurata madagascariensis]
MDVSLKETSSGKRPEKKKTSRKHVSEEICVRKSPKLIESGINVTKIAAFIAACEYNDGSKNRIDLMCALNLKINKTNNLNCVNIDKVRKSTAKRQVSETFLEARKAKNLKILKEPEECKLAESNIYAAGAF